MSTLSPSSLKWLCLVLKERYGHDFSLQVSSLGLKLHLINHGPKYIHFPKLEKCFYTNALKVPFTEWDISSTSWNSPLNLPTIPAPGVSSLPKELIVASPECYEIHYDILGLTYWMLNRIEEIGRKDLDEHNRFPAISSHAYRYGYLERPIVDEWLNILGQVIKKQWPIITLKQHHFNIKLSHDVDSPSLYQYKNWKVISKIMLGHLLKRRNIKGFFEAPFIKLSSSKNLSKYDPFNTFEWIMHQSEKNNISSAFYFICGRTSLKDADYEPEDPAIENLMKAIHARGHEIGLHPSYNSYKSSNIILEEANRLRYILEKGNLKQGALGGRMHYLRWEHPTTLQAWNDANMSYDSTLGYADHPGFRCGTCFEYPGYNPVTQEILNIRIRPLVVMEQSIISKSYLGLGFSKQAEYKFIKLKETCQLLGGSFTLLWHNSSFPNPQAFKLYKQVINCNQTK